MDSEAKHQILRAYLVLSIMLHAILVIMNLVLLIKKGYTAFARDIVLLAGLIQDVAFIVSGSALLRWKKWGFWFLCAATAATGLVIVLMGEDIGFPFRELIEIAILLAILRVGKENTAWDKLT